MPTTVAAANQEVSANGKTQQHQETCTHSGLFHVIRQGTPENFASKLVADKDYPKGSEIATLEGLTPGEKRYTTVQISKTHHIELNSDLVFMNHSCDPSAHMNVDSSNVTALKDIKEGDELTFFYPSTEWDMAQPFDCWCGSSKCIKTVRGAQHIPKEVLAKFELSNHIKELSQI